MVNPILFSSIVDYITFDLDTLNDAKIQFNELKLNGVLKGYFEDNVWKMSDEYSHIGLYFTFEEFAYQRYYEKAFNMPLEEFINAIKAFIVSLFGKRAIVGIYNILLDIRHFINNGPEVYTATSELFSWSEYISNLIDDNSIEGEELQDIIENYSYESIKSRQRTLADYDTYFLFDDILRNYWKQDLSDEERLFYYPVYLWWVLTAVVPQRPREFLLLDRECLQIKNDKYYVSFRRSKNKGYNKNKIYKYTINEAYDNDVYQIPESLAKELQRYLELTKHCKPTELNTFFVTEYHYKKWGVSVNSLSRFFTKINFTTTLKYFYEEIIVGKYGYHIVTCDNGEHLKDDEIGVIRPGDTRHISLINLMQSGGTPLLGMLLAGHADKDMASHYYSNLIQFIQCKTYRQYRRYIGQNRTYTISSFTTPLLAMNESNKYSLLTTGKCASEKYQSGDYSDCLNISGHNGEIGYCPNCPYYVNGNSDNVYETNIKNDCEALAKAINLVRTEKGYPEDIAEVLNRLRGTALSYENYLRYKMAKENENGTKETG